MPAKQEPAAHRDPARSGRPGPTESGPAWTSGYGTRCAPAHGGYASSGCSPCRPASRRRSPGSWATSSWTTRPGPRAHHRGRHRGRRDGLTPAAYRRAAGRGGPRARRR
ncbi:hypothetical protein NKG94_26795 [Micromonospora sp. M12]